MYLSFIRDLFLNVSCIFLYLEICKHIVPWKFFLSLFPLCTPFQVLKTSDKSSHPLQRSRNNFFRTITSPGDLLLLVHLSVISGAMSSWNQGHGHRLFGTHKDFSLPFPMPCSSSTFLHSSFILKILTCRNFMTLPLENRISVQALNTNSNFSRSTDYLVLFSLASG